MTTISKLAIASAFAAFALTGAHATEEDTVFLLNNITENTPGVFTGTYPISNQGFDWNAVQVQPRVAGDTFVDDFLLQLQDTQDVSFYIFSGYSVSNGKLTVDVTFSSVSLTDLTGATTFLPVGTPDYELHSANASWLGLGSGTYDLEIQGVINANGASYAGELDTVPSVPEPTGWALMLAGLAAVGSLARRSRI